MADPKPRAFVAKPAERNGTSALLVGISAPSGGGKTYSALRVARGIQEVVGGEIYFIDTDNGRALDYADLFRKPDGSPGFIHVPFEPPHGSLAYRDAIRFCIGQPDCGVLIVDSMSHEHIAMLEHAEAELDRMAGDNESKRKAMKALSYAVPKAHRTALLTEIQRLPVPGIFCFRAKEGIKPVKNEKGYTEFVQQGFTPIAGDEFVFEMTICALLMPAAKGVPTWLPTEPGEKKMTKLPEQFSFLEGITAPMDEKLGAGLAKWARGGPQGPGREPPRQEPPQEDGRDDGVDMREEAETPPGEPDSGPGDDFPGDRKPNEGTRQATAEEIAAETERRAAAIAATAEERARATGEAVKTGKLPDPEPSDGFADFADVLADADDWPQIVEGLRVLTASPAWQKTPYDGQMRARAAAYHRLKEMTDKGSGLDFLTDPQAFRCYVEAEDDAPALGLNFSAFKETPVWKTLPDPVRDSFVTAVGRRSTTLNASASAAQYD